MFFACDLNRMRLGSKSADIHVFFAEEYLLPVALALVTCVLGLVLDRYYLTEVGERELLGELLGERGGLIGVCLLELRWRAVRIL